MSNYLFENSDDLSAEVTQIIDKSITQTPPPTQQTHENAEHALKFGENLLVQYVIGEGAVGRVYFAYDQAIGRRVAVKELLNNAEQQSLSPSERQRLEKSFIHEAKITGKLEHPGIIPVYQLGHREGGGAYYVMRYVKGGETLEEKIDKIQRSSPDQILAKKMQLIDTLIAACDAVAYAHSKGVIHRDLKPANIISGKFGETIVLDWGLAQVLNDSDDDFFTETHLHQQDTYSDNASMDGVGTLRYMAPEQFKGRANIASDVYSLGVILFKILTGSLPYTGNWEEIEAQLSNNKPPPSPAAYADGVSPELSAICTKALAKNPDDRFKDAGELAEQLRAYRDGRMVNIYSYSRQELLHRFLAKNKTLVSMIAVLFITVIIGAAFSVHYAVQMDNARAEAEKSLVLVTGFGEQAQEQASHIANLIQSGVELLFADMKKSAAQLDSSAQTLSATQAILDALHAQYPDFLSFTIENNSAVQAIPSWKMQAVQFEEPLFIKEQEKLVMMFIVPLKAQNGTIRYLTAKVLPEQVLPKFFPPDVSINHLRDIWLMRDDGLVFYDKEARYLGTNLFTDNVNTESPSVVAFGEIASDKHDGIGYYFFTDQVGRKVSKIAAWQTVLFAHKSWKIVVNYTYHVSSD